MNGLKDQDKWKSFLKKQSSANASQWLHAFEDNPDPEKMVVRDYDNLLRALEASLKNHENFPAAFSLIQSLHPFVWEFGDWDRWLAYLSEALTICEEHGRISETARLLEQTGDVLTEKGDFTLAIDSFEKSMQYYKSCGNINKKALVMGKFIPILDSLGNTAKAIATGYNALNLLKHSPDVEAIAKIKMSLSSVYLRSRQWQRGLKMATEAYQTFKSTNNSKFTTRALGNILAFQAQLSMWKEVRETSEELERNLINSNNKRSLMTLEINLGTSAYNQKNFKEAEVHWHKARNLGSQLREQSTMGIVCNNLGKLYLELEEWDEAEKLLKEAIAIYEKLENPLKWANSMDNLAELYEAMGNTAVCRQTLLEGITGLDGRSDAPYAFELLDMMRQRLANLPDKG